MWALTNNIQDSRIIKSIADTNSFAVSLILTACIVLFFFAIDSSFIHWFIIPVSLCGITIGIDAIAWIRKRIDFMDPVGMIGAYGYYFFL